MTGLIGKWINKTYRKKLFLKPLPNGTLEAIDITENEDYLQKETGVATVISPSLIVPVSGIKNVAYIAMKNFGSASLHNPFDVVNNPGLTEKMLADIIDESIAHGRNMAEGTGEDDKKKQSKATVTMIAAIAAAIFSVMIYLKVGI